MNKRQETKSKGPWGALYSGDFCSLSSYVKPCKGDLSARSRFLPNILPFYLNALKRFDPALIRYLSDTQKQAYQRTLAVTLTCLLEQYNLNCLLSRNNEKTRQSIIACDEKLNELSISAFPAINSFGVNTGTDPEDKLPDDWVITIPDAMHLGTSNVNNRRLDWLWTKTFIDSSLAAPFFPDPFHRVPNAQNDLRVAGNIGGMLSWSVYAVRFIERVYLLLALTFRGKRPDDEKKVPLKMRWEMFKIHFNTLKFGLLNDFAWGIANGLTYFWLTGAGNLGMYGGIVNIALFGMDFAVAIAMYMQAAAAYTEMYNTLQYTLNQSQADSQEQRDLLAIMHHLKFNRKYERASLLLNIGYALSIACAFFIISGVVITGASSLVLMTGIGCLPLSIAYTVLSKGIDLCKTAALKQESTLQIEVLLAYYNAVHAGHAINVPQNATDKKMIEVIRILNTSNLPLMMEALKEDTKENTEQYLFHLIRNSLSERNVHHDTLKYQRIKLLFTVMTQLIVPTAFFITYLVLPPLGIFNLLIFAAALLVTWLAHKALDKCLKDPEEKDIAQSEFDSFEEKNNRGKSVTFVNNKRHGLFGKIRAYPVTMQENTMSFAS